MLQNLQPGAVRTFSRVVTHEDAAAFDAGTVHPVYSTFALTRDAEWSGRLFVLELKEADEEGIGTGISVEHLSPALIGETVTFTATLTALRGNEVINDYIACVGDRIIAKGTQKQKILKKDRLEALFQKLERQMPAS
jgi:predicted thioesterase